VLESLRQPLFVVGFFEIGSYKLFAQPSLEPRSSFIARITGMSHRHLAKKDMALKISLSLSYQFFVLFCF
jgi:hypothetical protein